MTVMAVKDREEPLEALRHAQAALQELATELERVNMSLTGRREDDASRKVRELAEKFNFSDDALIAFVETAGELLGGRQLSVSDARRAGMLAAAGAVWENELGPMLSSAQVRELLGDVSRQRVDELLRSHRLIGLRDSSGRRRFPLFQFKDGRPIELLIAAYWTVGEGMVDEWSAASWCVAGDEALGGESPAQWARVGGDPERLLRVARQDSARLAR